MKVSIDLDLCETNALCVAYAPDVFEIVDLASGVGELRLKQTDVSDALVEAVRSAAKHCPVQAITLS
ncbi:MAG: ferredoxin [Acidobacteria bacterium]|nr:ferredoxin [Acidobacteriota bacterium]